MHFWTPKVCRIMAFHRFWAIILLTLGGLGCLNDYVKGSYPTVFWGVGLLVGFSRFLGLGSGMQILVLRGDRVCGFRSVS